jgi:uncharacterized protein with PQ loop repeat
MPGGVLDPGSVRLFWLYSGITTHRFRRYIAKHPTLPDVINWLYFLVDTILHFVDLNQ